MMKVYGVAAQAHSVEETFKNFESENLSIMMKKKWINMLMGMCAAVLLLSLGGCGKEDILDERTEDAAEEDAAVVNMASVTFNLQMEGTSRATYDLSGFDVYAYVYQDKKVALHDGWSNEEYEYYKAEKIEGNKYETELPENEEGLVLGVTERYRYRIVFLAAPKGSTVLNGSVRDDYNEAMTEIFNWYVNEGDKSDNAVYRNIADIAYDEDDEKLVNTDVNPVLYHEDGEFALTITKDVLAGGKKVKVEIGNVPRQMYFADKGEADSYVGTQNLTKEFDINPETEGDQTFTIHSLPQYDGITCKVWLYNEEGKMYSFSSFDSVAGVQIRPNTITKVKLSNKGFTFGIDLEDGVWDGPNVANN